MVRFSAELVVQEAASSSTSSSGKKRKRTHRYLGELSFDDIYFRGSPSASLGDQVGCIKCKLSAIAKLNTGKKAKSQVLQVITKAKVTHMFFTDAQNKSNLQQLKLKWKSSSKKPVQSSFAARTVCS